MRNMLTFVWYVGLVVAVAASAMLIMGALDPNKIPAPREAPVPLSSIIGD